VPNIKFRYLNLQVSRDCQCDMGISRESTRRNCSNSCTWFFCTHGARQREHAASNLAAKSI